MLKKIGAKRPKREQQIRQINKKYIGLYASFSLGLMITGFLISPYGKVNDVYVEGVEQLPEQLVLDASQISRHQTTIGTLASRQTVEATIISKLPKVKAVQVKREELHDIVLEVEEFETIAYLDQANGYHSVLENGSILDESHQVPIGNNPILSHFEQGPILNQFITAFQTIGEDVQNSISEITYKGTKQNPYKITLYMNDGNYIIANINDFAEKIIYYPAMAQTLKDKKGTIDMEVGAFFTPFDSKTTQEIDLQLESSE